MDDNLKLILEDNMLSLRKGLRKGIPLFLRFVNKATIQWGDNNRKLIPY